MTEKTSQPCWVYIMECDDGTYYTGVAKDINQRQEQHNAGKGGKYTNAHRPVSLVYFEQHPSRSLAMKREYEIKQLKRSEKEELVQNFL